MTTQEYVNQENAVMEIIKNAGCINISQLYQAMKEVMPSQRYIGIVTGLRDKGHIAISGSFATWEGGAK